MLSRKVSNKGIQPVANGGLSKRPHRPIPFPVWGRGLGEAALGASRGPDEPEGGGVAPRRRPERARTLSAWALRRLALSLVLAVPGVFAHTGVSMPASPDQAPSTEMIDPDCEPERAANADPAMVEEPDNACRSEDGQAEQGAGDRKDEGSNERKATERPGKGTLPRGGPNKVRRKTRKSRKRSGRTKAAPRARRRSKQSRRRDHRAPASSVGSSPPPADPGSTSIPAMAVDAPALSVPGTRVPRYLIPLYRAAGARYGIRWEILAAINEIETAYGTNLNVSYAGAEGWMQFMPATWRMYGTDANRDGRANPYDPVDAIFAAARYLEAAGYAQDVRGAIFAYNHATWYVDSVLLRAGQIAALPRDVLIPRTGATKGSRPSPRLRYEQQSLPVVAWGLALAALGPALKDTLGSPTREHVRRLARRVTALGPPRDRGWSAVGVLAASRPFMPPVAAAKTILEATTEPA
jgi:hypothetical protein